MSNYEAKLDLKNAKGIDTSKLKAKSDLASLKAEVDKKKEIDKLKIVPVDLSKVSLKVEVDKKEIDKLKTVPLDLSKLTNVA